MVRFWVPGLALTTALGLAAWHMASPSRMSVGAPKEPARTAGVARLPSRPSLIRLKSPGKPLYLWQAGSYHWVPRRSVLYAMGYRYRDAVWESAAPGPMGHSLTFFYKPGDRLGYWYHQGRMYPVAQYPRSAWIHFGHTVDRIPLPKTKQAVKILASGHVIRLRSHPARPQANALSVYSQDGVSFHYPKAWSLVNSSHYLLEAEQGSSLLGFNVYSESDRSPQSPLWFLGKYRVLPDDARTWSNHQGGVDYEASAGPGLITVGTVQPMPNPAFGYAFRLTMTVPRTRINWAWTVLDQWRLGPSADTAVLMGNTNVYGSPTFPVTITGPHGSVTTTATLDTGNEGPALINPTLARQIGLVITGRALETGVSGYQHAHYQPLYQGLSLAPKGTQHWMLYQASAKGWGLPGVDLGTDFLKYATETDNNGHWTITWPIQ